MTDDRKSGIALIAGSLGGLLTMAIHPVASGSLTRDRVEQLAFISGLAHSLALASFLALFLGCCGLTRRIASNDRIAFAGLVTFGFGCIAVFIAAAVSGFIVPNILRHMARDVPAAAQQWRIVIDAFFQINQAFSRIFSVASSLAIALWSISALRKRDLGFGIAVYGSIVAVLLTLGVVTGHLRLDVHGMTIVILGQVIWYVAVGAKLCSASSRAEGAV